VQNGTPLFVLLDRAPLRALRRGSPRRVRRQVRNLSYKLGTTTGFLRHSDSNMLKKRDSSDVQAVDFAVF
jgi:hypothetical protein